MKVLGLFAQKGGSGKSTLAMHLGVAASASVPVLLVDADPQATVLAWSRERRSDSPQVIRADAATLEQHVRDARRSGVELVVVDCPPHAVAATATLLRQMDLLLIPCQPSMPDLVAAQRSVALTRAAGKPFRFVINRAPARAPEVLQAQEALAKAGRVAPIPIGDRRAFARALTDGYAVTELAYANSKAAEEVLSLWDWVKEQLEMEEAWVPAA